LFAAPLAPPELLQHGSTELVAASDIPIDQPSGSGSTFVDRLEQKCYPVHPVHRIESPRQLTPLGLGQFLAHESLLLVLSHRVLCSCAFDTQVRSTQSPRSSQRTNRKRRERSTTGGRRYRKRTATRPQETSRSLRSRWTVIVSAFSSKRLWRSTEMW